VLTEHIDQAKYRQASHRDQRQAPQPDVVSAAVQIAVSGPVNADRSRSVISHRGHPATASSRGPPTTNGDKATGA
jgi:hypothetical protein